MAFQFINSLWLSNEINKFSAMRRDNMTGRSGQFLEPPRFVDICSRLPLSGSLFQTQEREVQHLQMCEGAKLQKLVLTEYYANPYHTKF